MKRTLSVLLLFTACASPTQDVQPVPPRRPNVLFLLSDDQRIDSIGALGNRYARTPNLDRLVAAGTTFTRAYCQGSNSGAVCAPSRAMILTGRGLGDFWERPEDPALVCALLPEAFREAGYQTFGVGKWHNGRAWFARSFEGGGDVFFGGMGPHVGLATQDFDPAGRYPAAAAEPSAKFSSEAFADRAIEFLHARSDDRPFFLYVAFTAPHDPRTPPAEYRRLFDEDALPLPPNYAPEHPFDNGEMHVRDETLAPVPRTPEIVREHLADYYGMIAHLDEQVGRILDALEETGEAQDTIVVFASDHGLALGSHGLFGKQNLYEHSARAPLILVGPGIPGDRKSAALCYLADVFPTLAELAGLSVPASVRARSLVPVLARREREVRDTVFLAYRELQRAIVTERYKLVSYASGEMQLFDLAEDPAETRNLAGRRDVSRQQHILSARLADWWPEPGEDL